MIGWISTPFEELVRSKSHQHAPTTCTDFDIIIVGSGYGGSVAASLLSKYQKENKPLRIAVLERGKEYLPGSFPNSIGDIPKHITQVSEFKIRRCCR